jgi:hypothetical protein
VVPPVPPPMTRTSVVVRFCENKNEELASRIAIDNMPALFLFIFTINPKILCRFIGYAWRKNKLLLGF